MYDVFGARIGKWADEVDRPVLPEDLEVEEGGVSEVGSTCREPPWCSEPGGELCQKERCRAWAPLQLTCYVCFPS